MLFVEVAKKKSRTVFINNMAGSPNGAYEFQQGPQTIGGGHGGGGKKRSKKMYRSYGMEDEGAVSANIMFDRRVVRGNTYAAQVVAANAQAETENMSANRSGGGRRTVDSSQQMMKGGGGRGVDPVQGRKHIDVQTDNYLEELTDRRPEVDEETQTDAYMDRPPLPLFIPTKAGLDKGTQVEGDLFDFDLEVQPILEVLVGKTLEQSMQEVLEEEELAAIRRRQEDFEQARNAELSEVQRLEAEARRKFEEKERRVTQESERIVQEKEVEEKVAARAFAKEYLTDLHENVFGGLVDDGHFYDPLVKEVEDVFMPWVTDQVVNQLDRVALSRKLAAKVLEAAVKLGQNNTSNGLPAAGEDMSSEAYGKLQAELDAAAAVAAAAAAAEAAGAEAEAAGAEEEAAPVEEE